MLLLLFFKLLIFLPACYVISALVGGEMDVTAAFQTSGFFLQLTDGFIGAGKYAVSRACHRQALPGSPVKMLVNDAALALGRLGCGAGGGARFTATQLGAMTIPANHPLPSVDLFREAFGARRSFWGDLNAHETRRFYHELLPVALQMEECMVGEDFGEDSGMTAEALLERARLASMARHAARLYARYRCALPSRLAAQLYDGLRHLKNYGTFRASGMTWDELWAKYEAQVRAESPDLEGDALTESVCLRIIKKSCCTSQTFDSLAGMGQDEKETVRRRKELDARAVAAMATALLSRLGLKKSTSLSEDTFKNRNEGVGASKKSHPWPRRRTRLQRSTVSKATRSRGTRT
ncbi:unnamed protein product [Choristocarpus tenellus]